MKMQAKTDGIQNNVFIRSTALDVFHTTEPFITIKTKCLLYYSSNPLNEQAVKCLGQFYITVQTVQQFSHLSTSSTRKWCPFGRQETESRIFFPAFSASPSCGGHCQHSVVNLWILAQHRICTSTVRIKALGVTTSSYKL